LNPFNKEKILMAPAFPETNGRHFGRGQLLDVRKGGYSFGLEYKIPPTQNSRQVEEETV
jgi:hypothetical protein